jgi:hypothetical protein
MVVAGPIAAVAALLFGAEGTPTTPPLSASAEFTLRTTDEGGVENVAGTVTFIPGGKVCVVVKSPVRQEMSLSVHELVVYYPDRDLALVANLKPSQAPPMLEAIAAGVIDPASTLPKQSKLLEHTPANGKLYTRWQVISDRGEKLGELRAWEARDGIASTELVNDAGKPQRRFSFADRVRVGARSVPRRIVAEFFGKDGVRARVERWELSNVLAFSAGAGVAECARRGPKTTVTEMQW